MGDDEKRLDIIKWIRRFLYAIIFLFLVFSFFLLAYSYIIESYTADSLKAMLIRQIGVVIFVSCSIGLITSELYSKVQSQKVKEELKAIIDSTWEQRLNILKAGITALYPHRGNSADKDVLEHLDSTNEGTIKLIGVSLKVFFSEELAFYSKMKDIIERKPNVKVQVLILNPNCEQALYRSESELSYHLRMMRIIKIEVFSLTILCKQRL